MRTPLERVVRTPLLVRGSLKPSILAPTWLARFETPSAHGRGGAAPALTFPPRRAYAFQGFLLFCRSRLALATRGRPRIGQSQGRLARPDRAGSGPRPAGSLHRVYGAPRRP